jgi:G3E family GTPase
MKQGETHMIKIDLITGFLGAGKTTFLKQYARHLMAQGNRIGILENDYGAVNVDMMLLQDLQGEQCELEMVSGGYDADCHKRRFKTKLITMAMFGYDRVIVEPSGIYDVDEFFDTLREEPLDNWYQIGNVIAIVDGRLGEPPQQTDYLLASQIANAGQVVLSRCQEVTPEQIAGTIRHLNRAMEQVGCQRRFGGEVLCKPWDTLTAQELQGLASCGYVLERHVKWQLEQVGSFESLFYLDIHLPTEEVRRRTTALFQDEACGHVLRVKGFLRQPEGQWLELNATQGEVTLQPIAEGQEIVIVIGEGLRKEAIDPYWA